MPWLTGLQFHYVMTDPKVDEYIFKQNSLKYLSYNWFTQQQEPQSSYCSTFQCATGLQVYYVLADPKVGENHI